MKFPKIKPTMERAIIFQRKLFIKKVQAKMTTMLIPTVNTNDFQGAILKETLLGTKSFISS